MSCVPPITTPTYTISQVTTEVMEYSPTLSEHPIWGSIVVQMVKTPTTVQTPPSLSILYTGEEVLTVVTEDVVV